MSSQLIVPRALQNQKSPPMDKNTGLPGSDNRWQEKDFDFGNVITDPKHAFTSKQAVLQTGHFVIVDVEVGELF